MDRGSYVNLQRPTKFLEGWIEHRSKSQGKQQWAPYWCVLRGHMIFLFENANTSRETIIGTLSINRNSRLEKKEGNEQTGYKFELFTANKANTFRTQKFTEREQWKAYVEGIARGTVPNSLDLLPGQIEGIRNALGITSMTHSGQDNRPPVPPTQRTNRRSSEPAVTTFPEGFDSPNSSASGSFLMANKDSVPPEDYLDPAEVPEGPRHRFQADPSDTNTPRWFFPNLSRHMAEKILLLGESHGNALMRESPDVKSLVISKRMSNNQDSTFTHYKVLVQPNGYKLEVVNPHKPMKTLSEVMAFFVETSGFKTTIPMTTNDYSKLGLPEEDHVHNYRNFIPKLIQDVDSGEQTIEPSNSASARTLPRSWHKTVEKEQPREHAKTLNPAEGRRVFSEHLRSTSLDTFKGPPNESAPPPPPVQSVPRQNPQGPVSSTGNLKSSQDKSQTSARQVVSQIPSVNNVPTPPTPPPPPFQQPPAPHQPAPKPKETNPAQKTKSTSPTPPPLPPNHPPPLTPVDGTTNQARPSSNPPGILKKTQQTQKSPEVASKLANFSNVPASFLEKLEQTLGGGMANPPATPSEATDSANTFNTNTVQNSASESVPPQEADDIYDDIPHNYCNFSAISKSQK